MSPEQCRGEAIDARSDQYSFAIMLYQLCTGKLPFEGDTPMAVALKHVNEPLPRPRLVNPNLPDGVEAVLVRALAKDRNLRFASVSELNQEFQKAVDDALTTGVRKVRTPLFDRSTQIYEKYQRVPSKQLPWYQRRSAAVAVVALALIGCPLSAWGMSALLPGLEGASANGRATVMVVTPEGMGATVLAMMTELAPPPGTLVPRETMNAAIAATFAAAGITYVPPTDLPTATPTATNTFGPFFPLPTPTPTRTLRPGETPPTSTRTPTPSRTATLGAGPSDTPGPPTITTAPSDTSEPPTNTSVPPSSTPQPPTNTAGPTNTPAPSNTPRPTATWKSPCGPHVPPQQCQPTGVSAPIDTPTP